MRNPVSDASAWKGDDLASSHDWIWSLSAADIAELGEALSTANNRGDLGKRLPQHTFHCRHLLHD